MSNISAKVIVKAVLSNNVFYLSNHLNAPALPPATLLSSYKNVRSRQGGLNT